jgi:glycine/D-amino acid oxidase-like deaminating enzyme
MIHVAGAGIFGLACAWEMTRRGATVRVYERDHVGAGPSGGQVGALAPHAPDSWNPKKAMQLDSLLAATAFWAQVEDVSGMPSGYGRTGRLQPVPDQATADKLLDRIKGAEQNWPADMGMFLTRDPDADLVPDSPSGIWLIDRLTARIHPRAALAALAAAITARGGEIVLGRPAPQDVTPMIWATGTAGLDDLNTALGRKIGQGVKGQSASLAYAAPDSPQVFDNGMYVTPHFDGTVAVGSTSENTFDHDRTDHLVDDIVLRARALCPKLGDASVLETWTGIRPRARSRAPVLAPWPDRAGHLIVNGGFKIGFGMAPVISRMAADVILNGRTDLPDLVALP